MTNDCKTCPVSTGTHKPAEALHQQIAEPQAEAMRLADECEESATHWVHEIDTRFKAAKMLRAQHALLIELADQLSGSKDRIAELESQVQRAAEIERAAILLRVKNRAVAGALLVEDFRSIVADRGPAQQAVQAAVPDGWQMVPAKPTEAMVGAIMSEGEVDAVAGLAPELRPILLERAGIAARYTAMLAAAPAHPAEGVPAQCPNINEPRGCWRVACQLGGKCREPERSATQPAAQGVEAERLRNLLCRLVEQLEPRHPRRDGNAPGHGHTIPGVWDKGNGELAGRKCVWCEVWQEALEVHAAAQAKQGGAANG